MLATQASQPFREAIEQNDKSKLDTTLRIFSQERNAFLTVVRLFPNSTLLTILTIMTISQ
jgi:hypothetical protein